MNYYDIYPVDTRNSKGFSTTLIISGCGLKEKCKKCFSPHLWNFDVGQPFTQDTEDYIVKCLSKPYISWFSVIGGNPTDNLEDGQLLKLIKRVREDLPNIFIAVWSGNTFEELIERPECLELLQNIDMLRDGRYVPELNAPKQFLQGSSNQKYVNCKESLKSGKVVEFNFNDD